MSVAQNTAPATDAANEPAVTGFDAIHPRPQSLGRCAITAVLSVGVVALLRWVLHPVLQEGMPYTMFLASVAISTHREGVRCGVGVSLLSILVGTRLFVMPWSRLLLDPHVLVTVLIFMAASSLIIWVIARGAATSRRLQEREWLLRSSYAERTTLERELNEARRLESLGRLAGGIAHDFNNLITVIMGSAELLQKTKLPDNPLLEAILIAATRSSEITRQLLGLGRRQMMVLQGMSINGVAQETVQLCQRLLPENLTIQVTLEQEPWLFRGDASLLQQILLNLLTNARDAMPDGGVVCLSTQNVTLDDAFALTHPDVLPGDYVRISVIDTGVGMDSPTRQRVFEPFFTAKAGGTGLGLAVVYGLVMQLKGVIHLDSELGKGSRFDIYLPRVGEGAAESAVLDEKVPSGPRFRVMLAEDHELVRGVLERMLHGLGHDAVVAEDGERALQLAKKLDKPLEVLVTDIGMPRMDGYRLAEMMRERSPKLGVVLISGYDDSEKLQRAKSEFGFVFLRKPFTAPELDRAIAQARAHAEERRTRISRPFMLSARN